MNDLAKFLEIAPGLQNYLVKTAAHLPAKDVLKVIQGKSAVSIFMALNVMYGKDFVDWESETLWLTLEHDGIVTDEYSRNKIQAAITLQHNPAFFWDGLVFSRTVQAFQDESTDPDSLSEPSAAAMACAVFESKVLRRLDTAEPEVPDFDEDVQLFVAVCLHRYGLVACPVHLEFAEEALEKQWPKENAAFTHEVKAAWSDLDKDALAHTEFPEDPLGIQLAKLSGCFLCTKERMHQMFDEIALLKSSVIS